MNNNAPSSISNAIGRAVGTLVLAAIALYIVERVFLAALPGLLVVLALVGICRVALGIWRRDGW